MENFIKNLIYFRKKINLTQEQQAQIYEMKRAAYATYEAGKSKPDYYTLIRISKINRITIDDLINIDLSSNKSNQNATNNLTSNNDLLIETQQKLIQSLEAQLQDVKKQLASTSNVRNAG